jgi:hypothetical protein
MDNYRGYIKKQKPLKMPPIVLDGQNRLENLYLQQFRFLDDAKRVKDMELDPPVCVNIQEPKYRQTPGH